MKAPNSKILSITAIIAAFFAIVCSVVNARNYARLVTAPPRSSLYYQQLNFDPFGIVDEMIRAPEYHSNAVKQTPMEVSAPSGRSIPRYSVSEENGVVQLEMEIPGVHAKDIEIELEDDKLLRIKGRRVYKRSNGSIDQSEFDVSFQLKENVDTSQLKVNLAAGILRVQVPNKVKEVKRISIGNDGGDEGVLISQNDSDNQTIASTSSLDAEIAEVVDGLLITGENDAY